MGAAEPRLECVEEPQLRGRGFEDDGQEYFELRHVGGADDLVVQD